MKLPIDTRASIDTMAAAKQLIKGGMDMCLCRFPNGALPELFTNKAGIDGGEFLAVKAWADGETIRMYPFSENDLNMNRPAERPMPFAENVPLPEETSQESYRIQFAAIQTAIANGEVDKVVLSRVKHVPKHEYFDAIDFFTKLDIAYPAAFVYLLVHRQYGMWIGASPEVLLEGTDGRWHTHSLAGTQPLRPDGKYTWGEKERREQELVSEHIRRVLHESGIDPFNETGAETVTAGSVAHLRTHFDFEMITDPTALLARLHPTPAVAGIPVHAARELIQHVEQHQRSLYTGYIGVCSFPERASLYVNLRCMQVGTDTLALYVGGGITNLSDADLEWQETEHKALTLTKHLNGQR